MKVPAEIQTTGDTNTNHVTRLHVRLRVPVVGGQKRHVHHILLGPSNSYLSSVGDMILSLVTNSKIVYVMRVSPTALSRGNAAVVGERLTDHTHAPFEMEDVTATLSNAWWLIEPLRLQSRFVAGIWALMNWGGQGQVRL